MAAGNESCSCPDCGAVCTGRFAGCTLVWVVEGELFMHPSAPLAPLALGPGSVTMADQPGATNGHSVPVAGPLILDGRPAPAGPLVLDGRPAPTGPLVLDDRPAPAGPLLAAPPQAAEPGPTGGGEAPPAAAPSTDAESLRALIEDLTREVRRLSDRVEQLADAPPPPAEAVLTQVDARFEWLTNQLSDRLVVLGNEVVAIKRHLTAGGAGNDGI